MEKLLNTLFPPKCIFCGNIGKIFCDNCLSQCDILKQQYCIVCDKPSLNGKTHEYCKKPIAPPYKTLHKTPQAPNQLLCIYEYKDLIRTCIKESKYSRKQFMALKQLSIEAVLLANEYEWGNYLKDFICVPIPISKNREKTRGFNQSRLIAEIFSWKFKLKLDVSILNRQKDTFKQHALGRNVRFENVKNAFAVSKLASAQIKGTKILLVDDICTTGATFIEASHILYQAGATEVICLALSKRMKQN